MQGVINVSQRQSRFRKECTNRRLGSITNAIIVIVGAASFYATLVDKCGFSKIFLRKDSEVSPISTARPRFRLTGQM